MRLDRWYGDPLSSSEADRLARSVVGNSVNRLTGQLIRLRLNHYLGESIEGEYRALIHAAASRSGRAHALVELLYGQLLISGHQLGAIAPLRRAERLTSRLLAPRRWIALVERHDALSHLPLQPVARRAQPLEELMAEANVIVRLKRLQRG